MYNYKEESRLKYEDVRKIALKNGVRDNKTYIGIWLKLNGYIKKTSMNRQRKIYVYYEKK